MYFLCCEENMANLKNVAVLFILHKMKIIVHIFGFTTIYDLILIVVYE